MPHDWPSLRNGDDSLHRLFAARCLIRDGALQRLRMEDVARQTGMSRFHFLRRFRETFGETPHRLAVAYRLKHARTLLHETELPVTEICFACGYESLGAFSTLFRRTMGCSPREYRRQRARFWPVNIAFVRSLVPFCLLDGFAGERGNSNFEEVFRHDVG